MNANDSVQSAGQDSPCIICGACCAFYRCSFYWAEADHFPGGTVPVALTEKLNDFRLTMRGMSGSNPRCAALLGEVGKSVRCSIYDLRSSVCREFAVAWENSLPNERCDKARIAWGLTPLIPPATRPQPQDDPSEPTEPPCSPPMPNAA